MTETRTTPRIIKESPAIPLVAMATLPIGKGRPDITIIVPFKKMKPANDIADFILDKFMKEDPDLVTKDFTREQIRGQVKNRIRVHNNVKLLRYDSGHVGYRNIHGETTLSVQEFRFYRSNALLS